MQPIRAAPSTMNTLSGESEAALALAELVEVERRQGPAPAAGPDLRRL